MTTQHPGEEEMVQPTPNTGLKEAVERARPVVGYEGIYSVTDDGRVWKHPRSWISGANLQVRTSPGRWLTICRSAAYPRVSLIANGAARTTFLHRLVAEAWVPNPEQKPQVNHIDGNKMNARADNLEWVSASENVRHAWGTGLQRVTEKMRAHGRQLPTPVPASHCGRGHP